MASINVGLTGGTKAPGGKGGEPRYLNKANNRMETVKAMRAYRAPANQRVSATARAMGAPRAHAAAPPAKAQPKSTPYVHYLGTTFGFPAAKGRGIEGLINASQNAERGTVLAPYQQKGREIGNTEQTVSNRVGQFNQQGQNALQGIVGQQEASAKTFENQAAETALQSQKGIETAGQNAITSSGGYLDPQLRAQIAASQAEITGLGQAGTTRANELGQAQNAYMRQLQAANVQRGVEGQKEIGNIYGAERARNTAAENQALGRLEAKAKAERITLPKELRTTELAEQKLREAGELGKAKINATERGNNVKERGQNITAETARRGQDFNRASAKEKAKIDREGKLWANQISEGKLKVSQMDANTRRAWNQWKMRHPKEASKAEAKAGRGYAEKIGTALSTVMRYKGQGKNWQQNARAYLSTTNKEEGTKATSNDLINAAIDIAEKGYLSPGSKAVAEGQGMNANTHPGWFR